jgi:hypothetical protein
MLWIDRIEKIARTILCLAIASAVVIVPLEYIKQHSAEAELKEKAKKAELELSEAIAKREEKPARLPIASMGVFLTSLTMSNSQGQLWFTNVSPRAGVVCLHGVAENRTTSKTSTSMAACQEVGAYASAVHMSFMFAGGDLNEVCPNSSSCDLRVAETQESKAGGG